MMLHRDLDVFRTRTYGLKKKNQQRKGVKRDCLGVYGSYNYNVKFYSVILAILVLLPFYHFYFYVYIFVYMHLSHSDQWSSTKWCRKKRKKH